MRSSVGEPGNHVMRGFQRILRCDLFLEKNFSSYRQFGGILPVFQIKLTRLCYKRGKSGRSGESNATNSDRMGLVISLSFWLSRSDWRNKSISSRSAVWRRSRKINQELTTYERLANAFYFERQ